MSELEEKKTALEVAAAYVGDARNHLAYYDEALIQAIQTLGAAGFSEIAIANVVNNMLDGSAQLRSITASFYSLLCEFSGGDTE